jgi:hypothetical protein
MDAVNRAAVRALVQDTDSILASSAAQMTPGRSRLEFVVNLRAGFRDLSSRSMKLTMTDDQLIPFLRKLDRLRAVLSYMGESV